MERTHRVHWPNEEELRRLPNGRKYVEVWEGLPNLSFKETTDRKERLALTYEEDGHYIWIPFDAYAAHGSNPNSILLVDRRINSRGKIYAWWAEPYDGSLQDAIEEAKLRTDRLNTRPQG